MPINTNINLTNEIVKDAIKDTGPLHFCTLDDLQKLVNLFNGHNIVDDYDYCGDYYEVYQRWCEKEQIALAFRQKEKNKKEGYLMRAENNKANKKYKCEACDLYTNNQKLYHEHILSREHFEATTDQDGLSKLCCTACGKDDFNSLLEVEKHKTTFACKELRTCPHCEKICTRKQTFIDHIDKCKEKQDIEKQKKLLLLEKLKQELGM